MAWRSHTKIKVHLNKLLQFIKLFTVAEIADFLYNVLFTVSCNYYSRRNSLSTFKKSLAVGSSDYNDQFVFNAWLPCPHFSLIINV